jgi:hypothetical protein
MNMGASVAEAPDTVRSFAAVPDAVNLETEVTTAVAKLMLVAPVAL